MPRSAYTLLYVLVLGSIMSLSGPLNAQEELDEQQIDMILRNTPDCPSRKITRIDVNAVCDPDFATSHACDAKYNAPSSAWQACYRAISECRNRNDALNKRISEYNNRYQRCHRPSSSCDQSLARLCQTQESGCEDICNSSLPTYKAACHQGCVNRYDSCKSNAGCRDF
jgi:hypothetical protein